MCVDVCMFTSMLSNVQSMADILLNVQQRVCMTPVFVGGAPFCVLRGILTDLWYITSF